MPNGNGENMRKLKVYYNFDPEYNTRNNTHTKVWVKINRKGPYDTLTATRKLISGELDDLSTQSENYAPVGIFHPTGAPYTHDEYDLREHIRAANERKINRINYETILPEELQKELQSRLDSKCYFLRKHVKVIECIRGVPPT